MKVAILGLHPFGVFPALYHLGIGLAAEGAEVLIASRDRPEELVPAFESMVHAPLPRKTGRKGLQSLVLWHADGLRTLAGFRPDWIVAEHELVMTALAYAFSRPFRPPRIAACFWDYYQNRHMAVIGRFASRIDAYVDVCDLREEWRRRDWPRLTAPGFIMRHAPLRGADTPVIAAPGPTPRIVFTSSAHVLVSMDRTRLARFFERLCARGVAVDWYFFGEPENREMARALVSHPLYRVLETVPKSELYALLPTYDVGLHWAPPVEAADAAPFWQAYFQSAASNKIGEYVAAGLAVAHAGNPGLGYLPQDLSVAFDATEPERGADQLADRIGDPAWLQAARAAARRYHRDEMNAQAQGALLRRHILGTASTLSPPERAAPEG